MIYRTQIIRGLRLLKRTRNPDGGIAATKPGVVSGCWTTAEALEALLTAPYHDIDLRPFALGLIKYLQSTQFTGAGKAGGTMIIVLRMDSKEEVRALGQTLKGNPSLAMPARETDYGTIEFAVQDPDNYLVLIAG